MNLLENEHNDLSFHEGLLPKKHFTTIILPVILAGILFALLIFSGSALATTITVTPVFELNLKKLIQQPDNKIIAEFDTNFTTDFDLYLTDGIKIYDYAEDFPRLSNEAVIFNHLTNNYIGRPFQICGRGDIDGRDFIACSNDLPVEPARRDISVLISHLDIHSGDRVPTPYLPFGRLDLINGSDVISIYNFNGYQHFEEVPIYGDTNIEIQFHQWDFSMIPVISGGTHLNVKISGAQFMDTVIGDLSLESSQPTARTNHAYYDNLKSTSPWQTSSPDENDVTSIQVSVDFKETKFTEDFYIDVKIKDIQLIFNPEGIYPIVLP